MNRLESSAPAENAPFVQRHLPDIDGVIEHEVSEPQEAARQIELIDQVANGYEMSIV